MAIVYFDDRPGNLGRAERTLAVELRIMPPYGERRKVEIMELMNSNVEDPVMETGKKPYEKPLLIKHGTIDEITGGVVCFEGSGPTLDGDCVT